MSFSKYDQIFQFISQYKYEIRKIVADNLKCGKCKNILINAYCVPCGCSYCCDCVNEMLNNGVENCLGISEECKDALISNNYFDIRVNKEISKVVMQCPEEMCLYECAIINMEEHVRVCDKKSIKCPFADSGCDGRKNARETLNDHCQSANLNHCKILIEMIDNMRNEIDILKANDKKNQLKIENLERNLKSKDEIIDKISEDIKSIIFEKESVRREFDSFKQNMERKIEVSDDKMKKENERIKIEKDERKRECDEINENLERKIKEIFAEVQKEKQERIKSINDERKSINAINMETNKKSEMMETKTNKLNKILNYFDYARIEWTIDNLDERRKQGGCIFSEYFTGRIKQYKLQLSFYADGESGDIRGKGCSIYLYICSGENGQTLYQPFTADVTIIMMSKTDPNINKNITIYCKIDKAPNRSERFDYLYCDLTRDGETLDDCFIVDCFIDFN